MLSLLATSLIVAAFTGAVPIPPGELRDIPLALAPIAALAVAASDTATLRLHISGMTCGGCVTTAELALKKLEGVRGATVTLNDSLGVVTYDPAQVTPEQIAAHLTKLTGFRARVLQDQKPDTSLSPKDERES